MTEGERPRPIPVRELLAMEAEEAEESATSDRAERAAEPTPSPGAPPRLLRVNGSTWTATALGTTRTGEATDAGALLLLVRFTADTGKEDAARSAVREGLAVARSLDEVDDESLRVLWERSRIVLK